MFVSFVSGFSCRRLRMKPYFIQSVFLTTSIFLGHLLSKAYHDVQPELVWF